MKRRCAIDRTVVEAISKATVFTGQGIVIGGVTTAAAFLAMGLTHFKGIREMGIICGGGLLLCLIPMMTTLPALLVWAGNRWPVRKPASRGRCGGELKSFGCGIRW